MKKTTLYLPDELKESLRELAARKGISEAEVVREALARMVERERPRKPTMPLVEEGLGDSTIAERCDELLEGFGEI